MRNTLVTALASCAESRGRARARRFLLGLSADELLFIAEFVGSCILESSGDIARAALDVQSHQCRMAQGPLVRCDCENKLILLREFLKRSRRPHASAGHRLVPPTVLPSVPPRG
jgi:hypothetical protein